MTMVRQPAGIYGMLVYATGVLLWWYDGVMVCVLCGYPSKETRFLYSANHAKTRLETSDTWRWQLEMKLLFHMTLRLKLTSLNVFVPATRAIPDCKMDTIHLCSCPKTTLAKGRAIDNGSDDWREGKGDLCSHQNDAKITIIIIAIIMEHNEKINEMRNWLKVFREIYPNGEQAGRQVVSL